MLIRFLEYLALSDDVMKDFKLWEFILSNNDPSLELHNKPTKSGLKGSSPTQKTYNSEMFFTGF